VPLNDTVRLPDASADSDRDAARESVNRDSDGVADALADTEALAEAVLDASALRVRVRCRDTVSVNLDCEELNERLAETESLNEGVFVVDIVSEPVPVRVVLAVPTDRDESAVGEDDGTRDRVSVCFERESDSETDDEVETDAVALPDRSAVAVRDAGRDAVSLIRDRVPLHEGVPLRDTGCDALALGDRVAVRPERVRSALRDNVRGRDDVTLQRDRESDAEPEWVRSGDALALRDASAEYERVRAGDAEADALERLRVGDGLSVQDGLPVPPLCVRSAVCDSERRLDAVGLSGDAEPVRDSDVV